MDEKIKILNLFIAMSFMAKAHQRISTSRGNIMGSDGRISV
jgi:hypothetical protein